MLSGEAANINFTVFDLTRSRLKPTNYCTQGEHANHYTINVVLLLFMIIINDIMKFFIIIVAIIVLELRHLVLKFDKKFQFKCKEKTKMPMEQKEFSQKL